MKKIVLIWLLGVLLSQNFVYCGEIITEPQFPESELDKFAVTCPLNNDNLDKRISNINNAFSCLDGKELEAVKLERGRKFIVQSKQPMSSDTPEGALIDFVSVRDVDIFYDKEPSTIMFTGEVIENKPPRLLGRSSTLKLQINKIKVDNVTYPAEAYITKMGKKQIFAGILAGAPVYLVNLGEVADKGTVTIDKVYKDPCQYSCESITTVLRPFYYLGGAILQLADLLIAPIVCFFMPGKEIDIPENTAFEIKLENDISLLKL